MVFNARQTVVMFQSKSETVFHGLIPTLWLKVFEGIRNKNGERLLSTTLTPEEKKRRLVLKRVNMDGAELRQNFLRAGTMARVRGET
jgi:hypothetical protein